MKRLLISRALPEVNMTAARARFDVTCRDTTQPMTHAECTAALRDFDAILPTLGDAFTAQTFAEANPIRCTLLANFGVGYNHIDTAAAQAAGVAVTNTPGAVTDATADIAMTLMLMTARRAGEGERMVRDGSWKGWHPTQMLGMHLTGKTVGIIGMGRIGQAIARRCHFGFNMPVRYFNRSEKTLDHRATRDPDIATLAANCDVIVMAVPGGAQTHHLMNATGFGAMQPHAIFINIARGDVVDEPALIEALQTGRIAGAGLDVYELEPTVPDALKALENVTLLPHLGTAALEVRESMGAMALANLIAWEAGQPLPNVV